eukprot:scaffold74185_cov24-Prasinocladus_malaysianus.AAC.2
MRDPRAHRPRQTLQATIHDELKTERARLQLERAQFYGVHKTFGRLLKTICPNSRVYSHQCAHRSIRNNKCGFLAYCQQQQIELPPGLLAAISYDHHRRSSYDHHRRIRAYCEQMIIIGDRHTPVRIHTSTHDIQHTLYNCRHSYNSLEHISRVERRKRRRPRRRQIS